MADDAPVVPGGSPRELLVIEVGSTDASVRATLRGELDESTAPKLIDRLEGSVQPGQDLVIDAGGLTFCGSAGLSAFLLIERSVAERGGAVAVERPTPFLVQLLEMAGLDGLISDPPSA